MYILEKNEFNKRWLLDKEIVNIANKIAELKKQKNGGDGTREFLDAYHKEINKVRNKSIPDKDLGTVYELTCRILYHADVKDDVDNNYKLATLAKDVSRRDWGKVLGGIALALVGAVLVAVAVTSLFASFGTAAPLSVALGAVGIDVTTAAITAAIGVSGAGASATVATGFITAGFFATGLSGAKGGFGGVNRVLSSGSMNAGVGAVVAPIEEKKNTQASKSTMKSRK